MKNPTYVPGDMIRFTAAADYAVAVKVVISADPANERYTYLEICYEKGFPPRTTLSTYGWELNPSSWEKVA
jgi:hypothetical protein